MNARYWPCLGVKVFAGGLTPAIRFSCSSVPRTKEARMNVRYRVELSHAERTELRALLSRGKQAARKLKRAQILLAADAGRQRRGDRRQCRCRRVDRVPDQAPLRARQPEGG